MDISPALLGEMQARLDDYELLDKLGDGAFSVVFRARCHKTQDLVAIKVCRKRDLTQEQTVNVLKEVALMRRISHENIVRMIEFIDTFNYYYIVLELMSGGEIFHRIVSLTYFSEPLARHVICQVAEAVKYLHNERGIVHRDIKPENILLEPIPYQAYLPDEKRPRFSKDKKDEGKFVPGLGGGCIGRIKLADFGLSKVVWNTNTKTPCGTMGYTAPEVVKDLKYSKSVDMWAIGCVLYTMLCGFPPFYHENVTTLTEKVARGEFEFLSPWWDEISMEAKDLVASLLRVDPNQRLTIEQFFKHPWVIKSDISKEDSDVESMIHDIASVSLARVSVEGKQFATPRNSVSLSDQNLSQQALKAALDMTYSVQRKQDDRWGFLRGKFGLNGKLGHLLGIKKHDRHSKIKDSSDDSTENSTSSADPIDALSSFEESSPSSPTFQLSLQGASLLQRRQNVNQSV